MLNNMDSRGYDRGLVVLIAFLVMTYISSNMLDLSASGSIYNLIVLALVGLVVDSFPSLQRRSRHYVVTETSPKKLITKQHVQGSIRGRSSRDSRRTRK